MEPTEAEVLTKLSQILPTLDIHTVTTTDILERLKEHFKISVRKYKPRIKEEIELFVVGQEEKVELVSEHVVAIELKPLVYLRVTEYNGARRVDLRHFYEAKKEPKTVLKPTGKGIVLSRVEFETLLGRLDDLENALEEKEVGFEVELGSSKRATVTEFKGEIRLDVRIYYQEKGEKASMKPTKKGISLEAEILNTIKEKKDSVLEALAEEGSGPSDYGGVKRAREAEEETRSKKAQKKSEDMFSLQLNDKTRLRVVRFNGVLRTDFRNYYKDRNTGEEKPTQKGISLTMEQLKVFLGHLGDLKKAVEEKNVGFSVEIGDLRRASVSNFTGRAMIDVREYYKPKDKDELQPGKKGVSFDPNLLDMLMEHEEEIKTKMNE